MASVRWIRGWSGILPGGGGGVGGGKIPGTGEGLTAVPSGTKAGDGFIKREKAIVTGGGRISSFRFKTYGMLMNGYHE